MHMRAEPTSTVTGSNMPDDCTMRRIARKEWHLAWRDRHELAWRETPIDVQELLPISIHDLQAAVVRACPWPTLDAHLRRPNRALAYQAGESSPCHHLNPRRHGWQGDPRSRGTRRSLTRRLRALIVRSHRCTRCRSVSSSARCERQPRRFAPRPGSAALDTLLPSRYLRSTCRTLVALRIAPIRSSRYNWRWVAWL